jgi:hypothetical protein
MAEQAKRDVVKNQVGEVKNVMKDLKEVFRQPNS